jgi:hypothetical protein
MKRLVIIGFCIGIVSGLWMGIAFAQEGELYTVSGISSVNARSCPRLDCVVVTTFQVGETFLVEEAVSGDSVFGSSEWFSIDNDGELVYVHSSLVELADSAQVAATPLPDDKGTDTTESSSAADTEVDTSGWIRYHADGVSLRAPDGWIDLMSLMNDDEYLQSVMDSMEFDSAFLEASMQMVMQNDIFDLFLSEPITGANLNLLHQSSGIRLSVASLASLLESQAPSFGYDSFELEIIDTAAGEAIRALSEISGSVNGVDQSSTALQYVFIVDDMIYFLTFSTVPYLFEDFLPTFEAIAASFEVDES